MNNLNQKFENAYRFHTSGNLNEAERLYQEILKEDKTNYQVLALLGGIKINNKNTLDTGIDLIKESIRINPDVHFSYIFYGLGLIKKENYKDAKKQLTIAQNKNSHNANIDILFNLAICENKLGNTKQSIRLYNQIIELKPNYSPALFNLANIYFRIKEYRLSEKFYLKIKDNFKQYEVLKYLANIYLKLKDYEKSQEFLNNAQQIQDDYELKIIQLNLYLAVGDLNKLKEAMPNFNKNEHFELFKIRIQLYKTNNNLNEAIEIINKNITENIYSKDLLNVELAKIKILQKDYKSALSIIEKVLIDKKEKNSIKALIYDELNIDDKAEKYYQKSLLENDPETKQNYGLWLYKRKKFEQGQNFLIENRNDDLFHLKSESKKLLNKVILFGDQGVGDQIIYSKFINYFKEKHFDVLLYIDKRLVSIFKQNFTGLQINQLEEFNPKNINYDDVFLFMSSLPILLAKEIKNYQRYFFKKLPDSKSLNHKKNKLLIGLSWKSFNLNFGNEKSIPLDCIKKLIANNQNFDFINLQYGDVNYDVNELTKYKNFEPLMEIDKKNDLNQLFSIIAQCDFVITCSNITAHLSGIINKKCYLLTPFSKGNLWYWHNNESRSSWYESIEIYKQDSLNNWDQLIEIINLKISNS